MLPPAKGTFVSYAQNFEDVLLWRALSHVERGFYVDIGAQHPVVDSVSRAFYERGWRGVHVEPSGAYADLLRNERPEERVVQAAVGARDGVLKFFEVPDTGLSTADPTVAARHAQQGYASREIEVPSLTMDTLLAPYREQEIHWLKIDVEGYESEVIAGWTMDAQRPWIVVVESTAPLSQSDTASSWQQRLVRLGYEHAYFDGLNRFFVSTRHPQLADALKTPPNVFDRFTLSGTATSTFTEQINGRLNTLLSQQDALRARLETSIADLRENRSALSSVTAELATERQRGLDQARSFADQLEQVAREVSMREDVLSALRERVSHLQTSYDAIANSRSWRITRPLRVLAAWSRGSVPLADAKPAEAPRHSMRRRLLLTLFAYLHARPGHKQRMVRLVRRFPALDRRLRMLAQGRPGSQPRIGPQRAWNPAWDGGGPTAQRDLARRLQYLSEVENRLDQMQRQHAREIESMTQELQALRRGSASRTPGPAPVDMR